jgi:hypothetical protein
MSYEAQQKAEAADKQRRLQQKLATPKEMQFSARIAGVGRSCSATASLPQLWLPWGQPCFGQVLLVCARVA